LGADSPITRYGEAQSKFVLVARSQEGLEATAAMMETPENVSVVVADLGHVETLEASIDTIVTAAKAAGAKGVVLVNNAGTVGDLSKTVAETSSVEAIRSYFDLNVVSCAALTARFIADFASSARTIVNVSSLLAVKAFPGWGLYAAGKAARDML
jgi:sepiapterin reductase